LVWNWPAAGQKGSGSLDEYLTSSVPVLHPVVHFAILSWCFTDFFASTLQAEQLIKMSWLINLHITPGRSEGHLCCLYGDRWPHHSKLPLWTTLQVFSDEYFGAHTLTRSSLENLEVPRELCYKRQPNLLG